METNLIIAITNLIENPITNLISHYRSTNRANNMGDALEYYIKDLFCNALNEQDLEKKSAIYNKFFSYIGNQNNPPDIITVSYTHLRAHETDSYLVCRL